MDDEKQSRNSEGYAQPRPARFIWTEDDSTREFTLVEGKTSIGRADDNIIVIPDGRVSRYHCVVQVEGSRVTVTDLNSANGTIVNAEKVQTWLLQNGDHLRVGPVDFAFDQPALEPSPPPPPPVWEPPPAEPAYALEAEPAYTPEPEAVPPSGYPHEQATGIAPRPAGLDAGLAAAALPPAAMPPLGRIWFDEQGQKRDIEIGNGLSLGRGTQNNVILRDLAASRLHCKIYPAGGQYLLEDLDSTNGTFVNETRVQGRRPLQDGDRIRIGKLEIHFEQYVAEMPTMMLEGRPMPGAPAGPMAPPAPVAFPIQAMPRPVSIGTEEIIHLKDVVKEYDTPGGKVRILKSVNLQVYAGTFVGVRGPSGSGKSTLLNMITGIDHPTSGDVQIAGQSLNRLGENKIARWRGEHIGVIFQFFQLLPTLTVKENIMLPMDFCRKWRSRERGERAMQLLDMVGLKEHANKLPSMLSGGQQQRAAIARALANDPPLIVADEPTGNLDSKTADMVFQLFEALVDHGTTFLMVTHDVELSHRIPRVVQVLDGELLE